MAVAFGLAQRSVVQSRPESQDLRLVVKLLGDGRKTTVEVELLLMPHLDRLHVVPPYGQWPVVVLIDEHLLLNRVAVLRDLEPLFGDLFRDLTQS